MIKTHSLNTTAIISTLALSAFILSAGSPAQAAKGKTLRVDDDGQQDKKATFSSIQEAVDAASPGDTIKVAPGTYEESVLVDVANLTIQGAQTGRNFKNRIATAPDATKESIVDPGVDSSIGFQLEADTVTIDGFYIEGERSTLDATDQVGVSTSVAFSGYIIQNNVIRDNTIGIYFNSSGVKLSTVANNAILDNNEEGAAAGNGVYSDQGLAKGSISSNFFSGNSNYQILIANPSESDAQVTETRKVTANISITKNTVDAATSDQDTGGGVLVGNITDLLVSDNKITGAAGTGVFLAAGITNSNVSSNTIVDGEASGIAVGFQILRDTDTDATQNNVIRKNTVRNNARNGINLFDTVNNTVSNNFVSENDQDGIILENADTNLISDNKVRSNGEDGLFVDSNSEGNQITKNTLLDNADFDIEDDSTGNGTAGTANFYSKNNFATSSPAGLK